ncbi:Rab-like protein 6 [Podila epicladia]|nr:Rab-like protein 6 [Podila epicladia]KAG0095485.1 Rab-like protein 6 [Podila epicladia]
MFQKLWPFNSGQQNGAAQSDPQDHGVSTKVKPIHASFNKGIPLNMKIIIRGDIRTGKTSVFERLQGRPFRHDHEYRTTEQIQVANIPWQYSHTKDIIKVEVWDVVDKGVQSGELRTSTSNAALKIDNNTPASPKSKATQSTDTAPHAAFALDASTIDVYRNTDGIILVYDISKPWTFEYIAKTLADVPTNIPVLILSNFTDDSNRPAVSTDRLEDLMEEHNAERFKLPCAPANLIRHLDTSMKTGLGLKEIHESFGIPFLNVLRETHRKQFDQKTLEIAELLKALDSHEQERAKHSSQEVRGPVSPNDITPSKRPPLPAAIQTSRAAIAAVPQTSSPTSPARKARNEHINVEILSPTPQSAQNPAVLFEFNSGKLEEDFFHNVDLDAPPLAPVASTVTTELTTSAVIEPEPEQGNPMVAGDEDIGSSSRDDDDDNVLTKQPVWTPGQVEKELLERHMVKSAEETRLEEIEEQVEEENEEDRDGETDFNRYGNGIYQEEVDASDQSTFESVPPLGLRLQQDSDVESHHDYPVASAMYYKHEPLGFAEEPTLTIEQEPTSSLSSYQEIGDGDDPRSNPWGSTGNLLEGASLSKDVDATSEDDVKDVNEDTPSSSFTATPKELMGVDGRKKDVEIRAVLSTFEAEDVEEPSPVGANSENSADADDENQPGDEDETSPNPGQSESPEGDKKKKKKNKKKGKKGK